MPHYEVATSELDERLPEIERDERVIAVVSAGDGAVRVFTEPREGGAKRARPGERETR